MKAETHMLGFPLSPKNLAGGPVFFGGKGGSSVYNLLPMFGFLLS